MRTPQTLACGITAGHAGQRGFNKIPQTFGTAPGIGCIQHLQSGTAAPVRHWVEVLDEALAAA